MKLGLSWFYDFQSDIFTVRVWDTKDTPEGLVFTRGYTRQIIEDIGPAAFLQLLYIDIASVVGKNNFFKMVLGGKLGLPKIHGIPLLPDPKPQIISMDFATKEDYTAYVTGSFIPGPKPDISPYKTNPKSWFVDDSGGHMDWISTKFIEGDLYSPEKNPQFTHCWFGPIGRLPGTFQVIDDGEVFLPLFP